MIVLRKEWQLDILDIEPLLTAAVAQGLLAAGVVDKDAAHGFGRGPKEMSSAIPADILVSGEVQPGLVDQSGGLERLAGRFIRHFVRGEAAQFFIDQREQLLSGRRISPFDGLKNTRHVAHDW